VRVNYIASNGEAKQLTRTAYGSEEAKDLERKLEKQAKENELESSRKLTIQELYDEYMAAKQYEARESTLDKNRRDYRLYIQPTMANVRIDRLTIPMLQAWKISVDKLDLKVKSKQHAYGIFRAMLNYAVKMEYIKKNLLPIVGTFRDAMYIKPEMSFYTAEDFTVFIGTAKQQAEEHQAKHNDLSEWEYYVFFNIAFFTGLRKGEIHGLRWSDLDGSLLHVKRSIMQKLKGGDVETPPKNQSSIRTLQMPLPLVKILAAHKKRKRRLLNFSEDDRICGVERCLRDGTIQNRNRLYAELSGIKRIRIHDFRHSHVSVLANAGINIQEIARRLGHTRVEETWNTYSHLYPREEEKAVDILNQIA
jgi:integrase